MIKVGDILKMKERNDTRKVLAIVDELYAISYVEHHNQFCYWTTKEGLENEFDLPKEKWRPGNLSIYYYVDFDGTVRDVKNVNGCLGDEMRISFGNCFPTKSEAELARDKIREVLKNI